MARKSAADDSKSSTPKAPKRATKKAAAPAAKKAAAPKRARKPAAAGSGSGSGKSLVIVESPKKARSIEKFLGSAFSVKASMGHVRDLPKRRLGLDVLEGYRADYEIMPAKKETISSLKKEASRAEIVYLATDPDREGEAIAWHLQEALGLPDERVRRVLFYEITEKAVREAFNHSGPIDMDKVNAQQARRFLDRFVGYELSPLLWKKIARNLSAGRVQSVAVRLIAEREKDIRAFVTREYWRITANLSPAGAAAESDRFSAELTEWKGAKFEAGNETDAHAVRDALNNAVYTIHNLEVDKKLDRPDAPFKTSTLQQQAAIRLRFPGKKTMKVAQELYEGIDVGGDGPVGLITYMRTDSLRVSDDALNGVRDRIKERYGDKYLPPKPNRYAAGKMAQEAHEAIRPTDLTLSPERIKDRLNHDQFRLYNLIYRRFVASQMSAAEFEVTNVEVAAGEALFKTQGKILRFDGYRRVLAPAGKQEDALLPQLTMSQVLDLHALDATQHFTQPPPRYSEATLIKALEKENIGRPSTYAPIIQTVQDRGYVEQRERRFHATDLGMVVTEQLIKHFPKIMDVKFTAHMESELDAIVAGKEELNKVLDEFYHPFQDALKTASEEKWVIEAPDGTTCQECEAPMVVKFSKGSPFLSCSRYPDCKSTRRIEVNRPGAPVDTEHKCPSCGSTLRRKDSKRGPFLYCSGYPTCKEIFDLDAEGRPVARDRPVAVETEHKCPKCGKPMLIRQGPRGSFLGCSGYPKCRSTIPLDDQGNPVAVPTVDVKCPKCSGAMGVKQGRRGPFLGCLSYPKCRGTAQVPEDLKEKLAAAAPAASSTSPSADLKAIPVVETCEQCGGPMLVRRGRRGFFLGCAAYPKCRGTKEPGDVTKAKITEVLGEQA